MCSDMPHSCHVTSILEVHTKPPPTSIMLNIRAIRNLSVLSRSKIYTRFPLKVSSFQLHAVVPSLSQVRLMSTGSQDNKNNSNKLGTLASAGMALSVLAGKTKYLFVALKLTKAMPLVSMMLSSAAYSIFYGWPFAIGMVGLIFTHEMGHAIVMHRYGVPFSPMVFVPFMGAVIAMKEDPRSAYEEAMIAFGGPALGTAAALGCSLAAGATDSQLLYGLADFGYMINLFNLLPIGSLDGGRITNAVSPYFGVVGLAAGGALIYTSAVSNPIFYLIMMGGAYTTGSRLFGFDDKEDSRYYKIPRHQQAILLGGYAALVVALLLAMRENDKDRKTPQQLKAEKLNLPYIEMANNDGKYDDFFSNDAFMQNVNDAFKKNT